MNAAIICLCLAQAEPHAGIINGDIREAIQELREVRKANQEVAAESREWRGVFSRFDGHRIANTLRGLYWLVIAAMGSAAVYFSAGAIKQLAGVIAAVAETIKAWRAKT